MSAQELIASVPVTLVEGRVAVCNGGGGALGHPKVYINLDQGKATSCGACDNHLMARILWTPIPTSTSYTLIRTLMCTDSHMDATLYKKRKLRVFIQKRTYTHKEL